MAPIAMALYPADSTVSRHRLRWLVIGTAFVIAAIVGANALVLTQLHQNAIDDAQDDLLRQSLTVSELTERTLQSVDLVLTGVVEKAGRLASTEAGLKRLGSEEFHAFLKEKTSGLPQVYALGIAGADGIRLNHSRDWPAPRDDLSSRDYFQALKSNPTMGSFLKAPIHGSMTGSWVILISRPLVANDGRFLGVAYATTTLDYFQELFRSTSPGNGYATALVGEDGTLLTRYPMAGAIGMATSATVLNTLTDSRVGVSRAVSSVDQQARIAAAYRLLKYPLVVVVTQDEHSAFAVWRTTAFTIGAITSAMIAMMVTAAYLMARSWTQQDRLNAARAAVIESDKIRELAEVEASRQQDLAEQSKRFNAAVENMAHGLCMFDAEKRLVVCNDIYTNLYRLPPELVRPGTPRGEIIAHHVRTGILKGRDGDTAAIRLPLLASDLPADGRAVRIDELADGKHIRVVHEPMRDGGWVATLEDITDQRRAEQALDETRRFLDSIIENVPIAVAVKDVKTRQYVLVNRAFESMAGMPESDLLGRTAFDIHRTQDAEQIERDDSQALQDGDGLDYQEYAFETPMRGLQIQATRRILLRDGRGGAKYLISVIENVTERKKSEQRIAFLAHHDALTGLANRAVLAERIEEAAARQRRRGESFSVLLLDLDRFKVVNDTLGHPAGDALLRGVAERLKSMLRDTDVLARLGGDEFAIVQSGEPDQHQAARALAHRIIEMLLKPFDIEGHEVAIGTSIGIALAPEHGTSFDNLLKRADLALYCAKSSGRNAYSIFDPEMSEVASKRHEIETDLRHALQRNELILYYQPLIEAKSRRICGAEALIRWRHPTKGMISPDQFIPLAEETGLIAQIGEWVLRTACAEAATWPPHIRVAVNLSPVQFRKTDLPDVVASALAQSGLPPERLELEITETAIIESAAECMPILRQFKSLGIAIALDDFGTAYSSLSRLTMFPFDKIKIDKSFTQNMTKRADCAAIISATLNLAKALSIATTAEGVETEEQYRILRAAGVTSMQGYLFKRPCPISEIDFDDIRGERRIGDAA